MSNVINYRLQMCLTFIPIVGWFIVLMMGAYHIKRAKSIGFSLLYEFCFMIPTAVICYLMALIMTYLINPIGVYWKVVTISIVLTYVVLIGLGFLAMLTERIFLSKLYSPTNNNESNTTNNAESLEPKDFNS